MRRLLYCCVRFSELVLGLGSPGVLHGIPSSVLLELTPVELDGLG